VDDGGAHLALDVVADDRQPASAKRGSRPGFEAMNTGTQLTKAQPALSAASA
jgi:hypothetical protein